MFDMNPLNLPDAQMQQLIMLFVAGTLGFIIGYVERNRTARQLETELTAVERAVDECLRMPTTTTPGSDEDIVLNRIRARADELDLDRIGTASFAQADDLQGDFGCWSVSGEENACHRHLYLRTDCPLHARRR